jgi:hypothetical protein
VEEVTENEKERAKPVSQQMSLGEATFHAMHPPVITFARAAASASATASEAVISSLLFSTAVNQRAFWTLENDSPARTPRRTKVCTSWPPPPAQTPFCQSAYRSQARSRRVDHSESPCLRL